MAPKQSKDSGKKNNTVNHPKCFFDISADDQQLGRIVFELFSDTTPKTAGQLHFKTNQLAKTQNRIKIENFRALCTGEALYNAHYKNSCFHRVILRLYNLFAIFN